MADWNWIRQSDGSFHLMRGSERLGEVVPLIPPGGIEKWDGVTWQAMVEDIWGQLAKGDIVVCMEAIETHAGLRPTVWERLRC